VLSGNLRGFHSTVTWDFRPSPFFPASGSDKSGLPGRMGSSAVGHSAGIIRVPLLVGHMTLPRGIVVKNGVRPSALRGQEFGRQYFQLGRQVRLVRTNCLLIFRGRRFWRKDSLGYVVHRKRLYDTRKKPCPLPGLRNPQMLFYGWPRSNGETLAAIPRKAKARGITESIGFFSGKPYKLGEDWQIPPKSMKLLWFKIRGFSSTT